jgi:hypothetical protein
MIDPPDLLQMGLRFPVPALTVSQPFASMIVDGVKWVENRHWSTGYRGLLLIHAGKGTQYLDRQDLADYRTGCILAVSELAACLPIVSLKRISPDCLIRGCGLTVGQVLGHKHAEGPVCLILRNVRPCKPFACPGKQGLWGFGPRSLPLVAVPSP